MTDGERPSIGRSGPVVVDLRVLQSPAAGATAAGTLALEFASALEEHWPDLVGRYLLAPDWPPPVEIGNLPATGKVSSAGTPGAIHEGARVYLSLFSFDTGVDLAELWPDVVETEGLLFCAAVDDLALGAASPAALDSAAGSPPAEEEIGRGSELASLTRSRRSRAASLEALRHADAVLATAAGAVRDLAAMGVDPARVTLSGPGADVVEEGRTWSGAAGVLEQLSRRGRRPWRRRQRPRRLALLSPFPPIPSGVAEYSSRLVRALRPELHLRDPRAELDCFADGRDRVPAPPKVPGGSWYDARAFGAIAAAQASYDQVVLVLGNSEYHAGALRALRGGSGGIVMAHEVRMTNLLRYSSGARPPAAAGLEESFSRSCGCPLPGGFGRPHEVSAAAEETCNSLLLRDIAARARRVLVTSPAALRLATVDVGAALENRLGIVPFSVALEPEDLAHVRSAAVKRPRTGRFRVTSFGIVDPIKRLDVLVRAVAGMRAAHLDVELFLVGPVSESVSARLGALAAEIGTHERVHITGLLPRHGYLEHLGQADVAVQLRTRDGGEASAAVGDCLAAGVPTVVSQLGWLGDLPDDIVVKVPGSAGPEQLGELLGALLIDEQRRAELSARAAAWGARQTFARAAAALLDVMGVE